MEKKSAFEAAAEEQRTSTISEFIFFLKQNKKWWMLPLLIVLALLGLLAFLAGTGIAPFIYPLSSMQWAAVADINTTGFGGPGGGPGNFQAPPFDTARDVGDYSHVLAYDHFGNLYDATDTGLWRYTVTPLDLPHANFPIIVAIGASKS